MESLDGDWLQRDEIAKEWPLQYEGIDPLFLVLALGFPFSQ